MTVFFNTWEASQTCWTAKVTPLNRKMAVLSGSYDPMVTSSATTSVKTNLDAGISAAKKAYQRIVCAEKKVTLQIKLQIKECAPVKQRFKEHAVMT